MAPPEWVHEKRRSPEEQKKLARARMARILKQQAQEQQLPTQPLDADPQAQSPVTPVLGVSLQRLHINNSQPQTVKGNKRKRENGAADDKQSRRGSPETLRRGSTSDFASDGSNRANANEAQSPDRAVRVQPLWYSSIMQKRLQQPGGNRGVEAKLEQVKSLIKQCNEGRPAASEMNHLFDRIRVELHDLVFLQVSELALRRKRMLHDDSGIPQLFDDKLSAVHYPWDVKADAEELYNRWALRIFSVDLLRGINKRPSTGIGSGSNRSTDRIDPKYPGRVKADFYGQGSLVNGQWWPTQLCTIRDGAHGSSQGGIYATKGNPAYSIVLSGGNHYKDRDEGEEIWYSGTDGKEARLSDNTRGLILNVSTGKPVRVIRSHNIAQGASQYRPPRGFRYDGLYEVLSYQFMDQSKMACLFYLRRSPGQTPIRFHGKEMRPTAAEIREYDKMKAEIEAVERI